jgi:hypothetical protein
MNSAHQFIMLTYYEEHGLGHKERPGLRLMVCQIVGWMPRDGGGTAIQTTDGQTFTVKEEAGSIDMMMWNF